MRFGTSRDVRLTGALAVAAHPSRQDRATAMFHFGRPSTDPDRSRSQGHPHRCGGLFMRSSLFRLRTLGAVGCVTALAAVAACSSSGSSGSSSGSNSNSGTITVAVVSNPLITNQMIPLTTSSFEKQYPGIQVKFATYTEGDLRAAIEKNVSTHSNSFNVIMIGPYETPLFAKNGWLDNLSTQFIAKDPGYAASDRLQPIAKSLSYKGDLYAVPFYGESSMMFYNKSLFSKAGLTMPQNPTWAQVQGF